MLTEGKGKRMGGGGEYEEQERRGVTRLTHLVVFLDVIVLFS